MSRSMHVVHAARGRHDRLARLERRVRVERALRRGADAVDDMARTTSRREGGGEQRRS